MQSTNSILSKIKINTKVDAIENTAFIVLAEIRLVQSQMPWKSEYTHFLSDDDRNFVKMVR